MKNLRKPLSLIFSLGLVLLLFACKKDDPAPGASADELIANKWWCPAGNYAQQYFNSDGTWQQRLKTTDTPDTGNWSFSSDKKTISITNVKGGSTTQVLTSWSYTVNKLEANALDINYSGFAISYTPCP